MLEEQAKIQQEEALAAEKAKMDMEMVHETCDKIEKESMERDLKVKNLLQVNLELQNQISSLSNVD